MAMQGSHNLANANKFGTLTRNEIEYAKTKKKKILYLEN